MTLVWSTLDDLTAREAYRMFRMRVDIFVHEQRAPHAEIDAVDGQSSTQILRALDDGELVGCLRVYPDDAGHVHIGRVAVARSARGRGVGRTMIAEVIRRFGDDSVLELGAQSHLEDYYRSFGFKPCGQRYAEEGIPHVPLRRAPSTAS